MNDELVIKIKGSLNESLTKTEIQKQLKTLEKELDLTINTDQKQVEQLANQIKQLQSEINRNAKSTVIFNEGKTNKNVQQIQGEINEIIKKYQQLGTVTSKTVFDVDTGNIKGFNLEIEKANGLVEKLNFELQRTQNGENSFKDAFVLTSKSEIDRTEKIREQQLQTEQKINKEIQQQNQNLQHQIDLFQRQAKINVQNLQRTHGGYVDNDALNQYLNSVKQLNVDTPNASKQMQSLNMQFREIQTNAKSAAGALEQSGMSLREMISTAMTKFPVWMIASTAFYAPIRGLQDMISRLIEIDTLLTDINRVTDMSDGQITNLLNNALTASDQLSSKLTDVLSIMGDFARLGDFNADELTEMASTAQVLTNISDLDAKGSVDALTSAMLNYNIAAEDSIRIADKLNEVNVISLPLQ